MMKKMITLLWVALFISSCIGHPVLLKKASRTASTTHTLTVEVTKAAADLISKEKYTLDVKKGFMENSVSIANTKWGEISAEALTSGSPSTFEWTDESMGSFAQTTLLNNVIETTTPDSPAFVVGAYEYDGTWSSVVDPPDSPQFIIENTEETGIPLHGVAKAPYSVNGGRQVWRAYFYQNQSPDNENALRGDPKLVLYVAVQGNVQLEEHVDPGTLGFFEVSFEATTKNTICLDTDTFKAGGTASPVRVVVTDITITDGPCTEAKGGDGDDGQIPPPTARGY